MDVNYDVSGNMPVATGVSLLLHGMLAIAISTTLISSALGPQSIAVTVTLTQSNTAPSTLPARINSHDRASYLKVCENNRRLRALP